MPRSRRSVGRHVKEYLRWAQRDRCLLCSFGIRLHFHHIIASDDGGPEHYLNLVGLCPNHHHMIEALRRDTKGRSHSSRIVILTSLRAACEFQALDQRGTDIVNLMATDHPLSGIDVASLPADLLERLATDLLHADCELLLKANLYRPRVFLGSPDQYLPTDPYWDLQNMVDGDLQDRIDADATKLSTQVGSGAFAEVVSAHMSALGLPFCALRAENT